MNFCTDFADQAVMLPLAILITVCLAVLGWWRGCAGWLASVFATFLLMATLKAALAMLAVVYGQRLLHQPKRARGRRHRDLRRPGDPAAARSRAPDRPGAMAGAGGLRRRLHADRAHGPHARGGDRRCGGRADRHGRLGPGNRAPAADHPLAGRGRRVAAIALLHGLHMPAEQAIHYASIGLVHQ